MALNEENIKRVTDYLISFLVRDDECRKYVHYLSEREVINECHIEEKNVYIVRSDFFGDNYGKEGSLPKRPLKKYCGIKLFYGEPEEREEMGNIIVYADLIASSYFVLTRYEEMLIDVRDIYNNFPASESILVKERLIDIAIVDRYGRILRNMLRKLGHRVSEKSGFSKLYFTHDIDIPFSEYTFINMVKTIGKSVMVDRRLILHPFFNYIGFYGINPRKTWDYMLTKERNVGLKSGVATESICFIVSTEKNDKYTQAYIHDKKIIPILNEMRTLGAVLGMHTSFDGAMNGETVMHERQVLKHVTGDDILCQRNHFLRQIRPYDLELYEKAGFSDDFTTGFNEVIGFRLGTCHPVSWIDPRDARISNLTLHGMEIMDGSVIGVKPYQMELSLVEAKASCKEIIDEIYENNGELDFLCHNGMFEKKPGNYLKELYDWILDYIIEKCGKNECTC